MSSNNETGFTTLQVFIVCVCVLLCLSVLVLGPVSCSMQKNSMALSAGLVEGTLPGQQGVYWIKPEDQRK